MAKKICMEYLNGECRNPSKAMSIPGISDTNFKLECPHCIREDGKDGNGNQLIDEEKAKKVFVILKDKIEE